MTNSQMLSIALTKDLSAYENMKLLFDVLALGDGKEIKLAKGCYLRCMARVSDLAKGDTKAAAAYYELAGRYALYAAKGDFDMYMVACEWNREPTARFWLPRRAVLEGQHGVASKIQKFIDDPKGRAMTLSFPPGTGKTTLIKFLLAYIAGISPDRLSMYVSYSDGMVKMMFDSLKGILTDTAEYAHNEIFGNGSPIISAEYSTISYRRAGDFPTIGLASIGGSVTGRTRANAFMVTDDLVKNAEEAGNPLRLETLWRNFRDTLTTRMIGDKVKLIMLGTIWSLHDPISRMKQEHEGEEGYVFIDIPVCDENGHSNFLYNHPDNYTDEKIAEIRKSLDPVSFSCLYLQKPMEREGLLFEEADLRYYNGVLPCEADMRVFVCDVAYGGGDRLAMPIVYLCGDEVYLPDVVFSGGDKNETETIVAGKILQHQCQAGQFEANNGGDMYADRIDQRLRSEKYACSITSKRASNQKSKLGRIIQYAPDIKRIYFLDKGHRSREYQAFMDEVCSFLQTGKSPHDDAPDSLAQLCEFLLAGFTAKVEYVRRPF